MYVRTKISTLTALNEKSKYNFSAKTIAYNMLKYFSHEKIN